MLRVYRPTGSAASGITDLNTFFGYPAAINRTTGAVGPDRHRPDLPLRHRDQRWFVVVLTLEVDPATGNLLGPNHLDIAVSKTANPLGGYAIYRLPVQDDGTQGTPRHRNCPCIGDYPHIAADAYGVLRDDERVPVLETDPGLYGNNFNGAQVYAFDKAALVARATHVNVVQFQHTQLSQGGQVVPGFTLAPAQVPDSAFQTANNGTEYFLSSIAGEEAQPGGFTGQAASVGVYAVTNTKSLSTAHPALTLTGSLRPSEQYVVPPRSTQKFGPTPLANFCCRDRLLRFRPEPGIRRSAGLQRQPDDAGLLRPRAALRRARHRGAGGRPAAGGDRLVPGQPGRRPRRPAPWRTRATSASPAIR